MDDFTSVVHNIFSKLYTGLNLDSIELFQMNGKQYGHVVCALPDKGIHGETLVSLDEFMKEKTVKLPVYIRDKAAMYVAAVKENMTDEDKTEFAQKLLLLQNVATIGNFSDSLAASYKVMEDEERKCVNNEFRDSIKELVGDDCRDFDINYQPVVDKNGRLYGAEALVRINNGNLGKLLPAEFLPTAEYLGIMNHIGHYVFAKAVKTLRKWNETHLDLKMFINMAPTQLMMPKAAENIMTVVKQSEVNPENIYCEISEKIEFRDEKMALATLEILNAYGINISLDDFGSGKMSLEFLKDSHASMIKFDNSLIKKGENDGVEMTILHSITEIADILDIGIAFVGIEDEDKNDMALNAGADYLEGFYYGEALSEDKFEAKWLK